MMLIREHSTQAEEEILGERTTVATMNVNVCGRIPWTAPFYGDIDLATVK